jgi:16S rRNA (adenine1518-N6/adenine1519-N6)-dimethyltransferase
MSKNKLPRANKDLGQHFLRDQNVIFNICDDFKDEAEAILEIGPGPGILTQHLAQHPQPFHVIEKDKRFPEYLKKFIKEEQINLTDALDVNYQEFLKEKEIDDKKVWLVSNLPYNVGSPLLVKFLQVPEIKYMTLMFQKEVAEKVYKTMSSLMSLSTNYFDVKLLCKVPAGAFQPPPKVESAVITMVRKENPVVPLEDFLKYEKFLRKIYQFKRKQVGKVLKSSFEIEAIESALEQAGAKRTDRAETFNLEQIQLLYKLLEKRD